MAKLNSNNVELTAISKATREALTPSGGMLTYDTTDDKFYVYSSVRSNWFGVGNGPDGSSSNPFTTSAELQAEVLGNGPKYLQNAGTGTLTETYVLGNTLGYNWALAWVVTNQDGDTQDWWNGEFSGTNYFTSTTLLRTSTMINSLEKDNAKNALFNEWSFNRMLVREDYAGSIGVKAYTLNFSNTFRATFDGGIANHSTYTNRVSSVSSSGSFNSLTNTVDFNYFLNNDGARVAFTGASQEATGGVAARVDGHTGYSWKGNIARSDGGRHYNADGTTTDHTMWFFVS